jgi:hypothetical protein
MWLRLWLACTQAPRTLSHEGYVWQRSWTPEVRADVIEARPLLSALRVLALEGDGSGLLAVPVDTDALLEGEVVAVVRWDGRIEPPDAESLSLRMSEVAQGWRASGVRVRGVELDCDQPTSGLEAYAELVSELRARLPEDLQLSITALPTWASSPHLPALLQAPDEVVVQVHAVDQPGLGLFEPGRALRAVSAFAAAGEPLAVALPTYGARIGGEELVADPELVAHTLRELERGPREVGRVLWFRVPVRTDQRNWGLGTLGSVIRGEALQPALQIELRGEVGLWDLHVHNTGALDAVRLPELAVTGDCAFADALQGWQLEQVPGGWRFVGQPGWIRAGEARAAGWVRCAQPPSVTLTTAPTAPPPAGPPRR